MRTYVCAKLAYRAAALRPAFLLIISASLSLSLSPLSLWLCVQSVPKMPKFSGKEFIAALSGLDAHARKIRCRNWGCVYACVSALLCICLSLLGVPSTRASKLYYAYAFHAGGSFYTCVPALLCICLSCLAFLLHVRPSFTMHMPFMLGIPSTRASQLYYAYAFHAGGSFCTCVPASVRSPQLQLLAVCFLCTPAITTPECQRPSFTHCADAEGMPCPCPEVHMDTDAMCRVTNLIYRLSFKLV